MSVSIAPAVSRAAQAVLPALELAARRTGVDFGALFNTARLESGFNPGAKARTSSATGLFQFIDSTWLSMLHRHGGKHGIHPESRAEALALRKNPEVAALMAAEFMAQNGRAIEQQLGRAADQVDLYLAHFLGTGGAIRFLKAMGTSPDADAADLFPAAARANRSVFFASGQPRSLDAVYRLFAARLTGADVPVPAPATGTAGPQRDRLPQGATNFEAPAMPVASDPEARRAAQAAYLLLKSLGG